MINIQKYKLKITKLAIRTIFEYNNNNQFYSQKKKLKYKQTLINEPGVPGALRARTTWAWLISNKPTVRSTIIEVRTLFWKRIMSKRNYLLWKCVLQTEKGPVSSFYKEVVCLFCIWHISPFKELSVFHVHKALSGNFVVEKMIVAVLLIF